MSLRFSNIQRIAACLLVVVGMCVGIVESAQAQSSNVHYKFDGNPPPGAVGKTRLQCGGPVPWYFQPVEIKAPPGTQITMSVGGTLVESRSASLIVGLWVAPVYRLRVTNVPNFEGRELFPTIELVDRLYPPPGQDVKFPIPIELTEEDLRLAVEGNYVTRVIYLEDPDTALPTRGNAEHPDWYDAGPGANPLMEADQLGRPMAILRIGNRVPQDGPDGKFLSNYAPVEVYRTPSMPRPILRPTQPEQGHVISLGPESTPPEMVPAPRQMQRLPKP